MGASNIVSTPICRMLTKSAVPYKNHRTRFEHHTLHKLIAAFGSSGAPNKLRNVYIVQCNRVSFPEETVSLEHFIIPWWSACNKCWLSVRLRNDVGINAQVSPSVIYAYDVRIPPH